MTDQNAQDRKNSSASTHRQDSLDDTPSKQWPLTARALKAAGVATITVRYHGEQGIGGVVVADLRDTDEKRLSDGTVSDEVYIEFLKSCSDLLDRRHPEWYQGVGSFGVFTWDVVHDRLEHLHHQRRIDLKTSLHEGL